MIEPAGDWSEAALPEFLKARGGTGSGGLALVPFMLVVPVCGDGLQ
jgi:hypothetical protein